MKKKLIGSGMVALAVFCLGMIGPPGARANDTEVHSGTIAVEKHSESQFPELARINSTQAVNAALAETGGKVLGVRLEDENGYLIYAVNTVTPDKSIVDVKVDAGSGKVLAKEQANNQERNHNDTDREQNDQNREQE